ncbi:unnamed protein product [Mesocestoides corti]|uniref:H15 domain-containing protein n=1 Tax=Mesocestoides corti TaxID=53468 RepID=A0A0R3U7L5_MESCO|nr:unnamed protein product [Mesocestoides corti]
MVAAAAATTAAAPSKAKVPKAPATHPPFAKMIIEAIAALKERGGSSRQAIIKYINAHYVVDEKVVDSNVRRALSTATDAGNLVRVKGVGVNGSFKISRKVEKKPIATKKPKKESKAAHVKKTATPKKKAVVASKPTKDKSIKKAVGAATKPKAVAKSKKPSAAVKKAKVAKPVKPAVKRTPKKSVKK